MLSALSLTPPLAVTIFVAACMSGYQFRRVWKTDGPRWQLWIWGVLSAAGFLTLGFTPMVTGV